MKGGPHVADGVYRYANYTAGSIGSLIVQFLVRYNIKDKTKHQCMKGGEFDW